MKYKGNIAIMQKIERENVCILCTLRVFLLDYREKQIYKPDKRRLHCREQIDFLHYL